MDAETRIDRLLNGPFASAATAPTVAVRVVTPAAAKPESMEEQPTQPITTDAGVPPVSPAMERHITAITREIHDLHREQPVAPPQTGPPLTEPVRTEVREVRMDRVIEIRPEDRKETAGATRPTVEPVRVVIPERPSPEPLSFDRPSGTVEQRGPVMQPEKVVVKEHVHDRTPSDLRKPELIVQAEPRSVAAGTTPQVLREMTPLEVKSSVEPERRESPSGPMPEPQATVVAPHASPAPVRAESRRIEQPQRLSAVSIRIGRVDIIARSKSRTGAHPRVRAQQHRIDPGPLW